jgi:hypothetical protein
VRLLDDPRRADSPEGVVGVFTIGADSPPVDVRLY